MWFPVNLFLVYLRPRHAGKFQNLLSRVCKNTNPCPTCAPAPPPTTTFASNSLVYSLKICSWCSIRNFTCITFYKIVGCDGYFGGVSLSPNGTIDLTNNPFIYFDCLFAIGTLPPNTKITVTCTNIAGGAFVNIYTFSLMNLSKLILKIGIFCNSRIKDHPNSDSDSTWSADNWYPVYNNWELSITAI